MKINLKNICSLLSVLLIVALLAGCSGDTDNAYDKNNNDGYTVSIKYDANGGTFTTNTSVIVDSYNLNEVEKNSDGMAEIALITPDNKSRGSDAFTAKKSGYFLAGWYKERIEEKSKDKTTQYKYSGRWDFEEDVLEVKADKKYSAKEPVLTLYAAWVPLFEIEFYSLDSGELLNSYKFDPNEVEEILLPEWDEKTGALEMHNFPERSGYTFTNAYYDEDATHLLDTASFAHTGKIDYENGTATDHVMKLYVEWQEGKWYRIYNTEQFIESASLDGNYEIYADLDFTDEIWPTVFMYGNFGGVIKGNGHTFKNISFTQTNNSKVNAGLFGSLTEKADISGLSFENVEFTIKAGTRVVGTNYGLLAGTIAAEAKLNELKILSSKLLIDSSCYFGADDYSIGLVCGMGDPSVVADAQIECSAVGDEPDALKITVSGNTVTVEDKEE